MTKISFDIPDKLHADFKVACARNGVTMKSVLEDAIEWYIGEHGGEQ